jgi:hypothetical protein
MTIQDQITYSEVQLKRCRETLNMFMYKFSTGDKTFTFEKQMEIVNSWTDAQDDHIKAIKELKLKLN